MTFSRTAYDRINEDIANSLRKLQDIHIDITGTKTSLLRITESDVDLLGDTEYSLSSYLISNCVIEYPFSDIEILTYKDQTSSLQTDAISMWDILPVRLIVKLESSLSTTYESVNFDENDILVDVLYDQEGNKIPILLQSPVLKGTFKGKHLIQKTYECTLQRGTLEDDIQTIVDNYVVNLGIPEIDSSVPEIGASGIAVGSTISITFNVAMNSGVTENYLTITPSGVVYAVEWDSDIDTITITPSVDLSSGVVHYINFATGIESSLGVPSEGVESINFTTI